MPLLPVVLLCLVALLQVSLTRTSSLTPWKGGGFGMFSTTDRGDFAARPLRILVSRPQGIEEIPPPAELHFHAQAASIYPSYGNLRELAEAVASIESRKGDRASRIEVQVWGRQYDAESLAPRLRLLGTSTVDLVAKR